MACSLIFDPTTEVISPFPRVEIASSSPGRVSAATRKPLCFPKTRDAGPRRLVPVDSEIVRIFDLEARPLSGRTSIGAYTLLSFQGCGRREGTRSRHPKALK